MYQLAAAVARFAAFGSDLRPIGPTALGVRLKNLVSDRCALLSAFSFLTEQRDGSPGLETRGGSRQRFQPPSIFSSLIIGLMTADRLHPQLVAAIFTNFPNSRALKYAGIDCFVGIL